MPPGMPQDMMSAGAPMPPGQMTQQGPPPMDPSQIPPEILMQLLAGLQGAGGPPA